MLPNETTGNSITSAKQQADSKPSSSGMETSGKLRAPGPLLTLVIRETLPKKAALELYD